MEPFEIYFSDLKEDIQKKLLDAVHAKTPADMNWDIYPIAVCEIKELDDETDSTDE